MEQQLKYAERTTTRFNPEVGAAGEFWGWEVPLDLFLAGLVAGILILHALLVLRDKESSLPSLSRGLPPIAPLLLGLALIALLLDLDNKPNAWRFFTSLQVGSPMSWGSWLYLLAMLGATGSALDVLSTSGTDRLGLVRRIPFARKVASFCMRNRRRVALFNLITGVALVLYTGVLLSTLAARPVWNSAVILPLFLTSGLLSATALGACFGHQNPAERRLLGRFLVGLAALNLLLLASWLVDLASNGAHGVAAVGLFLGGPLTAAFWSILVVGLLLPALLEWRAERERWTPTLAAPALLILGALALRVVLLHAGQLPTLGG